MMNHLNHLKKGPLVTWLFRIYRGLYYPVMWGLLWSYSKFHYSNWKVDGYITVPTYWLNLGPSILTYILVSASHLFWHIGIIISHFTNYKPGTLNNHCLLVDSVGWWTKSLRKNMDVSAFPSINIWLFGISGGSFSKNPTSIQWNVTGGFWSLRFRAIKRKPSYFPWNSGCLLRILLWWFIIIPISLCSISSPALYPKQPLFFLSLLMS